MLISVAHAIALHTTIRRFVSGLDVRSPDLESNREWWWEIGISPNLVWVAGTVAFAGLAVALGRSIRSWAATDEARDPDAGTADPVDEPHDAAPATR